MNMFERKWGGWRMMSAWIEVWLAGALLMVGLVALALALSALINSAFAAPFLVSDPYPSTEVQPTEFVVTISGVPAPVITPVVETPQGKILRLDLGPLNLSGSRTVTAKARNIWGMSADSLPFTFTAGPPGLPTGITLSATE